MQTQFTPEVIDVIRLQALGSLRWRVLLGYPPVVSTIEAILAPVARRDSQIGAALRHWSRASAVAREGGAGNPSALRTAITRLADLIAPADRLGAVAGAVQDATTAALAGQSTIAAVAHLRSVRHVFEEYLSLRNRLVTSHLGLVRLAVQHLQVPASRHEDMVHEGVFGLIRALGCFDALHGGHFSTYATRWIHDEIAGAMAKQELEAQGHALAKHRAPGPERRPGGEGLGVQRLRVDAEHDSAMDDQSLANKACDSRPAGNGLLGDSRSIASDQRSQRIAFQELRLALPTLSPHERRVIGHRFELGGHEYRTLNELSDDLGLPQDRVQQIQRRALEKLRSRIAEMSSTVQTSSRQVSRTRLSRQTTMARR